MALGNKADKLFAGPLCQRRDGSERSLMDRTLRLPVRNNRELKDMGSIPIAITEDLGQVFLSSPKLASLKS